jgi:MoaA/NifB/PqqE/SkfB family radical SAM enzyme
MCDIWKRTESQELSAPSLQRHRESLIALGVQQVVFTGGEPLLHRDLTALTTFFHDLNIRITLLTTGLLLHIHASKIAIGIDEIIISLDGPPAIHNSIRRIPDAFEKIALGIATIRKLHPAMRITARTTIQKQNHDHLRGTVDAALAIGLNSISFLAADLSSTAFNREQSWPAARQDEISLTFSEVVALEAEIEALVSTHAPQIHSGFIAESESKLRRLSRRFREHLRADQPQSPTCNAPWVSAIMEVDGRLRPCFFHPPSASTNSLTLEEAINSPVALAFRASLNVATNPICNRCVCSLNYREDSTHNAARGQAHEALP